MHLVTLADHDTIGGALELCARHPGDTFVSVEVSARFPEDGAIVHVIAVDIDEAIHTELQRLRRNIFELAAWIEQQQIAHFWCHPLSSVNGRLRRSHLERCFLMFRGLEVRNGTRDAIHERKLLAITRALSPAILESWASEHPETPFINRTARWAHVGASDDHGSLAIGRAYTRFDGPPTIDALCAALRTQTTEPGGEAGTGTTLAHNCYGVLAGYLHASGRQLASSLDGAAGELHDTLVKRRASIATGAPDVLWDGGHTTIVQEMMQARIEPGLVDGWRRTLSAVFAPVSVGDVGGAADAIPAVIKAIALELPYLLAYRYHARDRRAAESFGAELGEPVPTRSPRVALFTDTIDHVNGLGLGLRRLLAEAGRAGYELRVVSAGAGERLAVDGDGIVRVPSVYDHRLAEYPELTWSIPHLPPIVRYLTEQSIDLVQCSTPGPIGLAGLIAGRLVGAKVIGQYHTDVPEYALHLTGDPAAAAIVRTLVGWFYRAVDHVLVPSQRVTEIVESLGVAREAITRVRRGVDLAAFSPAHRSTDAFASLGIGDAPVILYVGRISREKEIGTLIAAFQALADELPAARLVLVGDGPQRAELAASAPPGCVFTGTVRGRALAALYASATVFAFPSQTDTFGNVLLEAQASGLPVIVGANTAPRELMVDGITGLAVDLADRRALPAALRTILVDPALRAGMSEHAALHAARYDIRDVVHDVFACYASLVGRRVPRAARIRGLVA
jgi:glycosyltransferase involved in cell wall biosynthesis